MLRRVGTFFRLLRTAWVLVRHDAFIPKEYEDAVPWGVKFIGKVSRIFSRRARAENPGERFGQALEKLGPAYIKFGQIMATRGDIFEKEFAEGLSRLKDQVPAFPQKIAEAMLDKDWGEPWQNKLKSLSEPVAAASVAQVHKGVTHAGEEVAVKILRPNIVRRMTRDMDVIDMVAGMAERFVPKTRRLRPKAFVETARRSVMIELDLRLEAAAASEMTDVAFATGYFRVPDIHWDYSDKNVLVCEWIDGLKMSSPDVLDLPKKQRQDLARKVIQSFLSSSFEHEVFHADMHEGNMIIDGDGELVLIDFGILGRIGKAEKRFEIETLYGFIQRDYLRIAQVHFDIGYVPPHHSVEDFASALRAVGEPIFGKLANEVSMSKVLMQLLEITEMFDMQLQPQLLLLQKTMMQAEGVARRLDDEFDMWDAAAPIVSKAMRDELGPKGIIGDLLDDFHRVKRAVRKSPDAIENISELAKAWRKGDVDLGKIETYSANGTLGPVTPKPRQPLWKGFAWATLGSLLTLGGVWAAGYF